MELKTYMMVLYTKGFLNLEVPYLQKPYKNIIYMEH